MSTRRNRRSRFVSRAVQAAFVLVLLALWYFATTRWGVSQVLLPNPLKVWAELKDVLSTHPGGTEVHLKLTQPGRFKVMKLDDKLRVTPSPALFGDLKALLGPSCLV